MKISCLRKAFVNYLDLSVYKYRMHPKKELIVCSEVILSNLINRILQHLRNMNSQNNNVTEPFLDYLNELTTFGTPLRRIFVK